MNRIPLLIEKSQEELKATKILWENGIYSAAVSRAYYCLYHASQALLAAKNINVKSHKGLIQQFGQHFIKTGEISQEFSKILTTAFDLRQLSDYDETVIFDKQQTEFMINSSQEFLVITQHWLSHQNIK
ncbi:MAG: hypothetical protein RLZZ490_1250 [Cyanobacteriota bacterium]|jgi:uncharacterized protein (UPF0332 family)